MRLFRRARFLIGLITALAGMPATTSAGEVPVELGLRWQWASPESEYGFSVASADFNSDGDDEIVVRGCENRCWMLLEKGGAGYRQLAASPVMSSSIDWLTVSDVEGGPLAVIHHEYGDRIDISTLEDGAIAMRPVDLTAWDPLDAQAADLDGDGNAELVIIDEDDLFVHDYSTGLFEIVKLGYGGSDLSIGQADLDQPLEIAVAGPFGSCWIVDGATLEVEWGAASGCGPSVELSQLLPDPPLELLTVTEIDSWSWAPRLFDPPSIPPVWTADDLCCDFPYLAVADVAPEPGMEVLVNLGSLGALGPIILGGTTGDVVGQYTHSYGGPLATGDLDGDGQLELLLGYGRIQLNVPLYIVDAATGELENRYPQFAISNGSPAAGDIDADGDRELVLGGRAFAEAERAAVLSFDGATGYGPRARRMGVDEYSFQPRVQDVALGEVDLAPGLDLCASYDSVSAYVACMPANDGGEYWRFQTGELRNPLALMDLEFNGVLDVATGRRWSGPTNVVTTHRADFGWLNWQSPNLYPELFDIERICHGDLDGATGEQVVAIEYGPSEFRLLDPVTGLATGGSQPDPGASFVACPDLQDDGDVELLASRYDGVVALLEPATGAWGTPIGQLAEPIYAVAAADFLGLGGSQIAVLTETLIQIIDPSNGSVLATYDGLLGEWSEVHQFEAFDLDGDDRYEIVFRSRHKLYVVGLPPTSTTLLIDGFESGDAAFWSWSPL